MDSVKNSFKPATHNQNQTAKPAPPPLCLEDSFFRSSARVKKKCLNITDAHNRVFWVRISWWVCFLSLGLGSKYLSEDKLKNILCNSVYQRRVGTLRIKL